MKTIRLRVDSYIDRQSLISGLANSGYKVWIEEKTLKDFPLTKTCYMVCFDAQEEGEGMNNIVCGHGQLKRQCPLCEKDEQIAALESILRRIIDDLPTNRDWLDPELEKAARDILKGESDGAE